MEGEETEGGQWTVGNGQWAGVGLRGAVVTWEAVHAVAGKAGVGAAGPRGGQRAAAAAGEEEWKERRKVKGR